MKKINLLDSSVFNRISAGEVVERPASIVKELVENAIDAGATNISIEICGGGIDKIRISDNGCGIENDDIETAFLPHATSKINSIDDLENISTLGFRGEALPSIASVAKIEIISKTKDSLAATKLILESGKIIDKTEIAAQTGTTITASNIFYNIPARLKFLKKPKSEEAEITNYVSRLIFANPTIKFKYIADNSVIYQTYGSELIDDISTVYGGEVANNLIKVDYSNKNIKISGYISKPEIAKPNRTYQTLIINGRYVVNYMISSAISTAFDDYLMKGKFPLYVLSLTIPFDDIDVNVHPSKLEVKFNKSNEIFSAFSFACSSALKGTDFSRCAFIQSQPDDIVRKEIKFEVNEGKSFSPSSYDSKPIEYDKFNANINFDYKKSMVSEIMISKVNPALLEKKTKTLSEQESFINSSLNIDYDFNLIGTAFKTYLIIEQNDTLYLIDQHAAHERMLYDKLVEGIEKNAVVSQELLVPYVFNANSTETAFLCDILPTINSIGFDVTEFGSNCFKVSKAPYVLKNINLKNYFNDVLSNLSAFNNKPLHILKDKLCQTACKAAVKGGDNLENMEISRLIKDLEGNNSVLLCPHGRPIIIKLARKDIEKWFKRIV